MNFVYQYTTTFLLVLTNLIVVSLSGHFLSSLDFSKVLILNLILSLSIILEAGAVPIFSKIKKLNNEKVQKHVHVLFLKRVIALGLAFLLLIYIFQTLAIDYGLNSTFNTLNFTEYALILFVCILKVIAAPERGIILGSEKIKYLTLIQSIDFAVKMTLLSVLIISAKLSFFAVVMIYLISNIVNYLLIALFAMRLKSFRAPGSVFTTRQNIVDEFKKITLGTSIWVFFTNIDKLTIGAVTNHIFFNTYSISSTIGSMQSHIFGPAIPIIGQKYLRREKTSAAIFVDMMKLNILFLSVFIMLLLILNSHGELLIRLWIGNTAINVSQAVNFAMWLSVLPLCYASNGLAFQFQFAHNNLKVYNFMNYFVPVTNSLLLFWCVVFKEASIIPSSLAILAILLTVLNYLIIWRKIDDY